MKSRSLGVCSTSTRHSSWRIVLTNQFSSISGNHSHKAYEIEGMLPMHDQKSCGSVIEVQILAQQTPYGERLGACIAGVVAECLNIAGDIAFYGQHAFVRSTRAHSIVLIDGHHPFPQIERRLGTMAGAKVVAGDGH